MTIIEEGAEAPGFELASHKDENVALSDFKGKKVMLVFYPLDFTPT